MAIRSQTMATRSQSTSKVKAWNDRNYQERSLASEMDIQTGFLRRMMDDVMVDDEHSVGFNQHAWEKLQGRLHENTKYAVPMKLKLTTNNGSEVQEHLVVLKRKDLVNCEVSTVPAPPPPCDDGMSLLLFLGDEEVTETPAPSAAPSAALSAPIAVGLTPAQMESLNLIDEDEAADEERELALIENFQANDNTDAQARLNLSEAALKASEDRQAIRQRTNAIFTAKKERRARQRHMVHFSAPPKSNADTPSSLHPSNLLHRYANPGESPFRSHQHYSENQDPNRG